MSTNTVAWRDWLLENMPPDLLDNFSEWLQGANEQDLENLIEKMDEKLTAASAAPKTRPEDAEELLTILHDPGDVLLDMRKPNGAVATVWNGKPVPPWIQDCLKNGYKPDVCKSAAGYYIGALDNGEPYARYSVEYWPVRLLADRALANDNWTMRQNP